MKRTLMWMLAGVVGLAGLGMLPAWAEEPGPPDLPRAKQAVIRYLELTPEQVAAMDDLLAVRAEELHPLRLELRHNAEALRVLLEEENPDPFAVGELILAGRELRLQIAQVNREFALAFEELLEPHQKARLLALRRAERLEPLFPAFRLFGLLPPRG